MTSLSSILNLSLTQTLSSHGSHWTPVEDDRLRAEVAYYTERGEKPNFSKIAMKFSGRDRKSCYARWVNHLNDKIVKVKLTDTDHDFISSCVALGGREDYRGIAEELSARNGLRDKCISTDTVKNYCNSDIGKTAIRIKELAIDRLSSQGIQPTLSSLSKELSAILVPSALPEPISHSASVHSVRSSSSQTESPFELTSRFRSSSELVRTPTALPSEKDQKVSELDELLPNEQLQPDSLSLKKWNEKTRARLVELAQKHTNEEDGTPDWPKVMKELPGYTLKQCKQLWQRKNPKIDPRPFNDTEKQLIVRRVAEIGRDFKTIALEIGKSRGTKITSYRVEKEYTKYSRKISKINPIFIFAGIVPSSSAGIALSSSAGIAPSSFVVPASMSSFVAPPSLSSFVARSSLPLDTSLSHVNPPTQPTSSNEHPFNESEKRLIIEYRLKGKLPDLLNILNHLRSLPITLDQLETFINSQEAFQIQDDIAKEFKISIPKLNEQDKKFIDLHVAIIGRDYDQIAMNLNRERDIQISSAEIERYCKSPEGVARIAQIKAVRISEVLRAQSNPPLTPPPPLGPGPSGHYTTAPTILKKSKRREDDQKGVTGTHVIDLSQSPKRPRISSASPGNQKVSPCHTPRFAQPSATAPSFVHSPFDDSDPSYSPFFPFATTSSFNSMLGSAMQPPDDPLTELESLFS